MIRIALLGLTAALTGVLAWGTVSLWLVVAWWGAASAFIVCVAVANYRAAVAAAHLERRLYSQF